MLGIGIVLVPVFFVVPFAGYCWYVSWVWRWMGRCPGLMSWIPVSVGLAGWLASAAEPLHAEYFRIHELVAFFVSWLFGLAIITWAMTFTTVYSLRKDPKKVRASIGNGIVAGYCGMWPAFVLGMPIYNAVREWVKTW